MENVRSKAKDFVKKEAVLVASAVLMLLSLLLVPPSADMLGNIDVRLLCILFCFMISIAGLRGCHVFSKMAIDTLRRVGSTRMLCIVLILLPLFCSMLFTNDISLITFVPLSIAILEMAGQRRLMAPVIVMQTFAANLGSSLMPFGNPHNLLAYTKFNVSTPDFIMELAPMVVVGVAMLFVVAMLLKNSRVSVDLGEDVEIEDRRTLVAMVAIFLLCILVVVRVLDYRAMLAVTVVVALVFKRRLFREVDYSLLLTFACLYVFSGNLAQVGPVSDFLTGMMSWDPLVTVFAACQVMSNVPASVLLSEFTTDWGALAVGADVGGFGTPIASMASIISLRFYMRTKDADVVRYLLMFMGLSAVVAAVLISLYEFVV